MKSRNCIFGITLCIVVFAFIVTLQLNSKHLNLLREERKLTNEMYYATIFNLVRAQNKIYGTISSEITNNNANSLPIFLQGASLPELRIVSILFAKQPNPYGNDDLSDLLDRFWEIDNELKYQISDLSGEQLVDLGATCGELSKLLIHSSTKKHDSLMEFIQSQDYDAVEYGTVVGEINHRLDHIASDILHID